MTDKGAGTKDRAPTNAAGKSTVKGAAKSSPKSGAIKTETKGSDSKRSSDPKAGMAKSSKAAPPKAGAPAAAKAPGKGGSAVPSVKAAGGKSVSGKPVSGKASGGKAAAPPAEPPPPARKIQVMQRTTLKPGARGTKAPQVHADNGHPVIETREPAESVAKKRRSAELTTAQLDHFRELLLQRRARLSSDLSMMQDEALKVTAQDNSSDSVADTGTDNYEQDFTLGLIESEEALAREVEDALVRVDAGAFGVCEGCQTPIPLARLEILPFARMCVGCQQQREQRA